MSFKLTVPNRMFCKGFSNGSREEFKCGLQLEPKAGEGRGSKTDFPCQYFIIYTLSKVVYF